MVWVGTVCAPPPPETMYWTTRSPTRTGYRWQLWTLPPTAATKSRDGSRTISSIVSPPSAGPANPDRGGGDVLMWPDSGAGRAPDRQQIFPLWAPAGISFLRASDSGMFP